MTSDLTPLENPPNRADPPETPADAAARAGPGLATSITAGILGPILGGLLGIFGLAIAVALWGNVEDYPTRTLAVQAFLQTPLGFLLSIITVQLGIGAVACVAAGMSPVPFRERLSLRAPGIGFGVLLALMVASLGCALAGATLVDLLQRTSLIPNIGGGRLEFARRLVGLPQGWAIVAILCTSVLPGLNEELLFRGFVQNGLRAHWRAPLTIGVTSALFAIAHYDISYVVFALPIGVWLGYMAWRSGSVLPGMLCHAATNATFQIALWTTSGSAPVADERLTNMEVLGLTAGIVFIGLPAAIYAVRALERRARTEQAGTLPE